MDIVSQTYLLEIMHGVAQSFLAPTIVVLLFLIILTLFLVGQIIVEFFSQRRHYKENLAGIVNEINDANYDNITETIAKSKLLRFQKSALIVVSKNMGLPPDSLFALAQIQINSLEKHYKKRLAWTDLISKIAPLLGLMGTLIPLGPGIVALGQNNIELLSRSLAIAFDTTILGIFCAVLAVTLSKIRNGWYTEYIETLESLMTCILEKADDAREKGVALPTNYTGDPLKEFKKSDKKLKSNSAQGA